MQRWTGQTAFTDPGANSARLAALSPEPEHAARALQGLLIHGDAPERYGLALRRFDRETLTVAARLAAILETDNRPLDVERPPQDRAPGTCRDYSVLMCALMRQHGRPARVRCGFASYFLAATWQDHWICEVWSDHRWQRVDAQLDRITREALQIGFAPWDVPPDVYLTADEAWRRCRAGDLDPEDFGHADARGLWFVYVNLMRDRLALVDCITSDWDGWRAVASARTRLSDDVLAQADRLADQDPTEPLSIMPWWRSA